MRISTNQRGSAAVLVVALVVVAIIGFAGYRVLTRDETAPAKTVNSSVPAKINSKSDVQKAEQALDQTDVDSVNPDQLDSDIDSL